MLIYMCRECLQRKGYLNIPSEIGGMDSLAGAINLHRDSLEYVGSISRKLIRRLPLPKARLPQGFQSLAGLSRSPDPRRHSHPEPSAGQICP